MPVPGCFIQRRVYSTYMDKIQIGYAGRLEIMQKRADLLIELVKQLELKKVPYIFHIAGTGIYFNEIKQYIKENKLEEKIIL